MPQPLTGYITAWVDVYVAIASDMTNFNNDLLDAATQCDYKNWAGLAQDLRNMSVHWLEMKNRFTLGAANLRTTTYNAMHWIDLTWGAGAVTMDSILTAMLGSSFDQLQKFIGIEDAYRVALWNAPFNADFYAALARGFQKWP